MISEKSAFNVFCQLVRTTEGLPDKSFLVSCNLPSSKYDYITTDSVYYSGESPGKDLHLPSYLLSEQEALRSIQKLVTGKVVIDHQEIPNYFLRGENGYVPQDGIDWKKEERYMLCKEPDRGIWKIETSFRKFPYTMSLGVAQLDAMLNGKIVLDAGQILRFLPRDENRKFVEEPCID